MKTYSELTEKQIKHNINVFDKTEKEEALINFLDLPVDEWDSVNASNYDENTIEYLNEEYIVVTDDEADVLWDEYLDNYIDDCLEIPEHIKSYFDSEKWKDDAKMDGRAHCLASYDGCENYSGDFYIYRIR